MPHTAHVRSFYVYVEVTGLTIVTSPRGDVTYLPLALTTRLLRQSPRALTATQNAISQGGYFKYSSPPPIYTFIFTLGLLVDFKIVLWKNGMLVKLFL